MTAPSKVSGAPRAPIGVAVARKHRKFPVSDGAPVEIVETGPSIRARLLSLTCRMTVRPTLAVASYVPNLPWPWGIVDIASRALLPQAGTVRATIGLPHADAQLVRAPGVLPADGKRRIVLYMHGGAFLTCGVNSHNRIVTTLSTAADAPVLVVNYRMIPKHTVGMAVDDCRDAYAWLRLRGYGPDQIVLAGASEPARSTACKVGTSAIAATRWSPSTSLCTLCWPSIGRRKGFMVRLRPVARSCTETSKVAPMRSVSSFSARTSAWGEKP